MTDAIRIVAVSSVHAGQINTVKGILGNLIDDSKARDLGLLSYDFFLDDSESNLYSLEWFRDSGSLLSHLGNIGEILNKLSGVTQIQRLEVFGNVSVELIEALAPFNAKFIKHWDGFTR